MAPKMKRPAPGNFPATGRVILVTALGQRRFYQDHHPLSTDDTGVIHAETDPPTDQF